MAITLTRVNAGLDTGLGSAGMSAVVNVPNVTVTGDTFKIPNFTGTITNYGYNTKGNVDVRYQSYSACDGEIYINGKLSSSSFHFGRDAKLTLPSGTGWQSASWTATNDGHLPTENTYNYFNSSNPTAKTVPITLRRQTYWTTTAAGDFLVDIPAMGSGSATLTLNAPPVISATRVYGATSAGLFIKGITSAQFNDGVAQYGGTITSRKLTIGEQTAESTGNYSVKIPLDTVGTFTPSVEVTDSRGQTTTKTLSDITVIENVHTTFVTSGVSSSTTGYWKDVTTASVTVSDISVMEGYRATKVAFTVGSQTHEVELEDGETGATLSILLNEVGTFAPTVKVTDSRGVVTARTFSDITVNAYTNTSIGTASLARVNQNGLADDEGAYALLTMDVNYVYELGNLLEPIVEVTDNGVTSSGIVTWYESWNSTTGIDTSSLIDWTNYNPTSPVTLYGIVSGYGSTIGFDTQRSFQIAVTARDTQTSSDTITQTLDSAFYTIDFLAGGHGIAFGQPATQDGFFCNMDSHFKDHANIVRALFDFIHPVGSYYETSDTAFNPNTTWGGTWVLETEGQVHISAGSTYSVSGALTNISDGGEETHTLTEDEIPAHTHGNKSLTGYFSIRKTYNGNNTVISRSGIVSSLGTTGSGGQMGSNSASTSLQSVNIDASHTHDSVGNGDAHNNMQPYIVVNRWHRTA